MESVKIEHMCPPPQRGYRSIDGGSEEKVGAMGRADDALRPWALSLGGVSIGEIDSNKWSACKDDTSRPA